MHLGHIPSAYDCWHVARASGGVFIMIADDWNYVMGGSWCQAWSVQHATERYAEDLAWLGIAPDEIIYSTSNGAAHAEAAERLGLTVPGRVGHWISHSLQSPPVMNTSVRTVPSGGQYGDYYTMLKCVDDHAAGVNCFTRGADLLHEAQAYDSMWRRLYPAGFPPTQRYVPILARDGLKVSKRDGRNSVLRDLRDIGYEGWQVLDTVLALVEQSTSSFVEVPLDLFSLERVTVLERGLSPDMVGSREAALAWCGEDGCGPDVLAAIARHERATKLRKGQV